MKDPAEKPVDHLLTSGIGQRADRLVLRDRDNRTMGGWSRESLLAAVRKFFPAAPPGDARHREALELLRWLAGREMSPETHRRLDEFLNPLPKE